jgi:hypothetical protein
MSFMAKCEVWKHFLFSRLNLEWKKVLKLSAKDYDNPSFMDQRSNVISIVHGKGGNTN